MNEELKKYTNTQMHTAYIFLTWRERGGGEKEECMRTSARGTKNFEVISCIFAKFYDHFKISIVLQPEDAIGRITQYSAFHNRNPLHPHTQFSYMFELYSRLVHFMIENGG